MISQVRRRATAATALAAVVMLVAAACTDGTPEPVTPTSPIPAANATAVPLLPTTANALPTTDTAGFEALLAQLRGTPVVVNVWATWCEPCKAEAPRLTAAHERFGARVQFLGIDILDSRDSAVRFIADYGVDYPSLFDPAGAIRDSLGQFVQPVTAFYGRAGDLRHLVAGEISSEELEASVQAIART
jgi:thiol-disulfide isomerase/thioredoxin